MLHPVRTEVQTRASRAALRRQARFVRALGAGQQRDPVAYT